MASDRQLAANRANALLSTGPRSLAGRTRSSSNALKHGLTAQHAMLPGESIDEFRKHRDGMLRSLQPEGTYEIQLAERVADILWRLRRVPVIEKVLFMWTAHVNARRYDNADAEVIAARHNHPEALDDIGNINDEMHLGRMLETVLKKDLAAKLTRYEVSLQRQLGLITKELRDAQTARRLREAEVPRVHGDTEKEWVSMNGKWVRKIGPP